MLTETVYYYYCYYSLVELYIIATRVNLACNELFKSVVYVKCKPKW